jgi:membrane protein required for colicin V production
MGSLTALDVITLLLVGGGLVAGVLRGFAFEVLSLFAWVAAIIALRLFHTPATELLRGPIGAGAAVAPLRSCSGSSSSPASCLPAASAGRPSAR